MKLQTNQLSKRGGYRDPKPLRKSTSRLLDYLFAKAGGPSQIARDLETHAQQFCRWRTAGAVPLKWVGPLSRYLDCMKEALNYEGMIGLNGPEVAWETIVRNHVNDEDMAYILNGKPPKEK